MEAGGRRQVARWESASKVRTKHQSRDDAFGMHLIPGAQYKPESPGSLLFLDPEQVSGCGNERGAAGSG